MTRSQDVQATFAATLVDEWVRGGVSHAVVCPGSRSTPMALAVADHGGLAVHVHHDERSAGFLAVGIGLATGRPAIVVVTSGTAAAELHPAVVEAHQAAVPLLACTTDRPPELRDVGAPQTIDQAHLYGRAVRWFADPGVPSEGGAPRWRALAARALAEATGDHPGPVQLNLPFREPLVGSPGPLPPPVLWTEVIGGQPVPSTEGAGGRPWTVLTPSRVEVGVDLRALAGRRGVIVAGSWGPAWPGNRPGVGVDGAAGAGDRGEASVHGSAGAVGGVGEGGGPGVHGSAGAGAVGGVGEGGGPGVHGSAGTGAVGGVGEGGGLAAHRVAGALGWPVLADPRSPAWRPAPTLVAHLDAVLRSSRVAGELKPEVIVRLGPPPASRVVTEWLAGSGAEEIVIAGRSWSDPSGTATSVSRADPADAVASWAAALSAGPALPPPPDGWLAAWQAAATAASTTLDGLLEREGGGLSEPGAARELVAALPAGATLVVSSSMPVRDVERYAAPRTGVRIVANRGANGIDGVVSTAVGVAAGTRAPAALLIGDIAFLHDSNGLLGAARRGIDLVCVVVDNDGGGIFSFLPQAAALPGERFEQLFGTPHGLDLVAVARALGAEARTVDGGLAGEVAAALDKGGVHVLVVRTDRDANVDVHRRLDDAVARSVDAAVDAALSR